MGIVSAVMAESSVSLESASGWLSVGWGVEGVVGLVEMWRWWGVGVMRNVKVVRM